MKDEEKLPIEEYHKRIQKFVSQILPKAERITDFNGNFMYLVPTEGFNASHAFQEFEANKERLKIADWGLSQATLEDVFTKLCKDDRGNNA